MNETTAASMPGASLIPDGTSVITTMHFAIIGLLVVLTLIAILYGVRLKRRRRAAEREVEAHNEQVEATVAAHEPAFTASGTPAITAPEPVVNEVPVARPPTHERPVDKPRGDEPFADDRPLADEQPFADEPRFADEPPLADEPIAAAAPLAASPASEAVTAPAPGASGLADAPVTTLKGLGPKVAARLAEAGVTTVGQLAALDDDAAARLDAQLGSFTGRMGRDRWLEQARFLAAGDRAGFEAVFGKL
jgi:predicted flap endonuclease-1-like 5' DNA nuclease